MSINSLRPPGYTAEQWSAFSLWLDENLANAPFRSAAVASPDDSAADRGDPQPRKPAAFSARDRRVAPGQIRIWGAAALDGEHHLLALVLAGANASEYRLIPFSSYLNPALPGEWSTGRAEPAFKVLCFDLMRVVPAQFISGSRVIGQWNSTELAQLSHAWSVWAGRSEGTTPAAGGAGLGSGFGSPYFGGAADPRVGYITERERLMAAVDSAVGELCDQIDCWHARLQEKFSLPLAAASSSGVCSIVVVDHQGNRLAGYESGHALFTPSRPMPDPVDKSRATAQWELDGLDDARLHALGGRGFSWYSRTEAVLLGIGILSSDGRHAELMSGSWESVEACLSKLRDTVLLIHPV